MEIIKAMLLPAGIMLGIALIFGVLLVILSQVFSIEKDSKTEEVEKLLAGSNCGGCGKAGCAAFAEALIKGEAKLIECNSTSKNNKEQIAKLLGQSGSIGEDTVAVVHCNGGNFAIDKFEYQGYGDCKSAQIIAGGTKECPVGCMGLNTCNKVCPYYAIEVNQEGYAEVNKDLCTSCGACISNCPKALISRIPRNAPIYIACSNNCKGKDVRNICSHGCIACGICERTCPEKAIKLENNIPVIDYSKCVGCYLCVGKCPTKVIKKH
jgi:Na+-translocating ferredoxin:NAD+ oxidoreductase RNF subunit RnfB